MSLQDELLRRFVPQAMKSSTRRSRGNRPTTAITTTTTTTATEAPPEEDQSDENNPADDGNPEDDTSPDTPKVATTNNPLDTALEFLEETGGMFPVLYFVSN